MFRILPTILKKPMSICFSDQKESYGSNFQKLVKTRKRKFNKLFYKLKDSSNSIFGSFRNWCSPTAFIKCCSTIFFVKSKHSVLGFISLTNFLFSVLQDSSKSIWGSFRNRCSPTAFIKCWWMQWEFSFQTTPMEMPNLSSPF